MDAIKAFEAKYRQISVSTDVTLPYKYIPAMIDELSNDLKEIDKILSEAKDIEVSKFGDSIKLKINTRLYFFKNKLHSIPNKEYMEESDEEWIDKNKAK